MTSAWVLICLQNLYYFGLYFCCAETKIAAGKWQLQISFANIFFFSHINSSTCWTSECCLFLFLVFISLFFLLNSLELNIWLMASGNDLICSFTSHFPFLPNHKLWFLLRKSIDFVNNLRHLFCSGLSSKGSVQLVMVNYGLRISITLHSGGIHKNISLSTDNNIIIIIIISLPKWKTFKWNPNYSLRGVCSSC